VVGGSLLAVDSTSMELVTRYAVSLVVLLVAFATVGGAYVLARPEYRAADASEMIELAEQEYISPGAVGAAFAAEGVRLPHRSAFVNMTILNSAPPAAQGRPGKVVVVVGGRTGRVGFGPKVTPYDERFENVLVTYDGTDEAVVDRIDAAVAALER
jgi:hypothetical protein